MSICISGLDLESFKPLFGLDDAALAARRARRYVADAMPGFPCRVTLEDALPGERVILLNYEHQPADSPYRASHAIYVRETATVTASVVDDVPEALARRTLSLRAFDAAGTMLAAELVDGTNLLAGAERLLDVAGVAYLHAHYATRGCYAARIARRERFEGS